MDRRFLFLFLFSGAACGGSEFTATSSGATDAGADASREAASDAGNAGVDGSDGGGVGRTDAATIDSGGGPCFTGDSGVDLCNAKGLTCCGDSCANKDNDPLNCGSCGNACSAPDSMCNGGHCVPPTCIPACNAATQSCCEVRAAGPVGPPQCVDGPTCPVGCPQCN